MTAALFAPTAPTDPQLALIAKLAHESGWQPPAAVYSKEEASTIIGLMLRGSYHAEDYALPFEPDPCDGLPFR